MIRTSFLPLFVFLLVLAPAPAPAQPQGGVEGRLTDLQGVPVRAVTVAVLPAGTERIVRTVETDETGYFRVEPLAPGAYLLRIRRLGYLPLERLVEVEAGERVRVDLTLSPMPLTVEGLTVEGERSRARARFQDDAGITARELSHAEIRLLPGLAESDPLRAIEVLPGVISPTDFSAAYHVRGGSSDQNLILLDGFPLFNPFHLGGVFSVFNADMVDRVELQSGGFPSEFGGRVSSVLRVESDPGPGELSVDGGVSLLAARVAVAGGLPAEMERSLGLSSARWRVSGRRSYVDQLARPFFPIPYHIRDMQAVGEGWTEGGSRWLVTAYSGADVLDLARLSVDDFPLRLNWEWGNDMLGTTWMRPFPSGGSATAGMGLSRFHTDLVFPDFDDTRFRSDVSQLSLFARADRWLGVGLRGKVGASADRYHYDNLVESGGTRFAGGDGEGWVFAGFGQAEWSRPGRWLLETGVRLEGWQPDSGSPVMVPAPRLAAKRFFAEGEFALKGSLGRYAQYLHSVRDEEVPLGIDIWILAGERAPHVVSDQIQVGVEGFPRGDWFVALDTYFRDFQGVIANNFADDPNDPLDDFLSGEGRAFGADLYLERRGEGTTGSVSLSWLKADRTFPDALSGAENPASVSYAPVFDRRLDLDVVLRFPNHRGWDLGVRWHVGTGIPYTRPLAGYPYFSPRQTRGGLLRWQPPGEEEGESGERAYGVLLGPRNGERYPVYHRLDLSARRTYQRSWGTLTAHVDVLNAYNQTNVLFYFFDFEPDPAVRTGLSMFPFLPTVGLEFRF